jgi:hypothetical protein
LNEAAPGRPLKPAGANNAPVCVAIKAQRYQYTTASAAEATLANLKNELSKKAKIYDRTKAWAD